MLAVARNDCKMRRNTRVGGNVSRFRRNAFQALAVPKGGPAAVIENISADIRSVVTSPEFAEKVRPLDVFPKATSPQELDEAIRKEIERWTAIAKAAKITID